MFPDACMIVVVNARLYLRLWALNYGKPTGHFALLHEQVRPLSHCVSQMIPQPWLPGSDEDACAMRSTNLLLGNGHPMAVHFDVGGPTALRISLCAFVVPHAKDVR